MAAHHLSHFALPPSVDMETIHALQASLAELRPASSPALDASAVERLSTPYAQLLVSCLQAEGAPKLVNPSPLMRLAWSEFGLSNHFPLE